MRSGLIFNVSTKFANRYLLCRMVSASARKMHRDGVSTSQSINRSLQALNDTEVPGKKPPENQLSAEVEAAAVPSP